MARLRLIHWQAAEAEERAGLLRQEGHEVEAGPIDPAGLRAVREEPPAAFVISLDRIPSHGRDVGLGLRSFVATRRVPLVFVGGAAEKVTGVRDLLPDATFTTWERLVPDLERALAAPPADPVVPSSNLAGYSGTPLAKKLGLKAGMKVALVRAPEGFEATLTDLPEGVRFARRAGSCDLMLWFVPARRDMETRLERMKEYFGDGGLWICWPKRAGRIASDLTQQIVRETGLAADLVDFKVAAIDADWSGLRFTRRDRAAGNR
jgi:hypothetical protein